MRRSLIHYRRTHLAVLLGAAVACAVLTGALLVGDSVRGSLRDLTLARLGGIDAALVAERPFPEQLAAEVAGALEGDPSTDPRVAPLLALRGSAVHAETRARASKVAVLGIDDRFDELYPPGSELGFEREGGLFPPVILNRSLADELGAGPGDGVLLSFERPAEIPRETLIGRREAAATVEVLRLEVLRVVPDRGPGGFSLVAQQTRSLNAFVPLARLQRALFGRRGADRANLLVAGAGETGPGLALDRLEAALATVLGPEDLGLVVQRGPGHLTVQSREFVLGPEEGAALARAAAELGAPAQPVLTYLANSIALAGGGGREVPYSTVSALDPPAADALGPFLLVDGSPAPALAEDEILLNAWAAADLGAGPGQEVTLTWYALGPRDELSETSAAFKLRGVVAMEGLAVDPHLTPEFPGMSDAEDMSSWNPPFPVTLARIRDRDEAYWDEHRAAPKAFVSEAAGRRLWTSRFGDLTSVRIAPPPGLDVAGLEEGLRTRLAAALDPAALGLAWRPLKEEGLRAARGATDFAGLFLGLSMFLIASAAMLVGLLFRLGVEQRAREIGLRRAVGFRVRSVRRMLLAEGGLLAAVGALLGLAGAVGYAGAMIAGLRTWWLPAIGAPILYLHVEPATLAIGWLSSVLVVLLSVTWALRRLHRVPTPALLAGSTAATDSRRRRRLALPLALGAGALAIALVALAIATGATSSPGLAFGTGGSLLVAGLAFFAHRLGAGPRRANALGRWTALGMGARNSGRNRGRSLLSLALVACACFIVVVVAANRVERHPDVTDRSSGAGGFALVAESDVPLLADLNRPERRAELGFSAEAVAALEGTRIFPLRLLPGEDVSCLNLYRPERPRVLGVPAEMIARGGFDFQQAARAVDNPWTLLEGEIEPGVVPAIGDYNSVLWILHLGLGKDLVLTDESGAEVRLRLVGLLRKSIFQSELLISEENFTRLFPSRSGYSYFLVEAAAAGPAAEALESSLERFGFDAAGTAERLAAFQAVEDTYLSTFQTLGGLGLILGTLGLGIVLLRNVLERRGELAVLRAFGFRRASLSRMVLAENGVLLAGGILIGAVAGLVASAPRVLEAGAGLPWLGLAGTLAAVFAVGMLASVLAVAGTVRVPLLPALKAE